MQLEGLPEALLPAGNEVGMLAVRPYPGVSVEPVGQPAPVLLLDQQQSTLSRARPPSGTVKLSASSWISASTLALGGCQRTLDPLLTVALGVHEGLRLTLVAP